ncbi:hypothetical protein LR48_Vigan02g050100 [Vigna angularis]|uniref:Uncharacterized protein n=1 Tax=Phaseolus angularis TaxID=3914 RepID=A0A0L9TV24_PHAAN|nr:hypothetical protein LR48_Vigan02g050100 [Vigna angularis]
MFCVAKGVFILFLFFVRHRNPSSLVLRASNPAYGSSSRADNQPGGIINGAIEALRRHDEDVVGPQGRSGVIVLAVEAQGRLSVWAVMLGAYTITAECVVKKKKDPLLPQLDLNRGKSIHPSTASVLDLNRGKFQPLFASVHNRGKKPNLFASLVYALVVEPLPRSKNNHCRFPLVH